ncbi:MAG: magnesium transporter CorA family protein [Candidatus Brocadiae bacterium]|nr:magnesium transporter CorA family protein [Candidatus Brocadiia bacterium]
MIKYYSTENNKIQVSDAASSNLFMVTEPTPEEKKFLTTQEELDEHNLNSALDPDEVSRLEYETNHVVLILKKPKSYSSNDLFQCHVNSVGIFLFENKVIIISDGNFPLTSDKKFSKIPSLKSLVLKVLGYSIYHFMEHLRIMSQIADELEQKINSSVGNQYLINMFSLSKGLVYYLNAINSNGIILQKLGNSPKFNFSEEEKELLEDLIIDNSQCFRIAEIYSNILASMMDARASIISNNLNILMKTLTLLTIAIMVPTFVVSAFSMNVKIPMQEFPYAFWVIMSLAAGSVLLFHAYWKYKKW